jgi:hypothetical protein
MLSTDLAELYRVEPRALVQAVKRNLDRFPKDFMFQLDQEEYANLKSQNVISRWGGVRRARPYAFSELGVAMLSSVLKSQRAVHMNITIMRAFVSLREVVADDMEFARRLQQLEARQRQHGAAISVLVEEIRRLKQTPPQTPKRRIGFAAAEN